MDFYGYNSQEEAEKYWQLPDKSTWHIESVNVCARDKKCTGSTAGVYHYDDGTTDNGITAQRATVIIGNNKIMFKVYG